MRYVRDIDARGQTTHVVLWDDVVEQVRATQEVMRHGGADLKNISGETHDRPGYTFRLHRRDGTPYTDAEKRRWLGRVDLVGWYDLLRAVREPWQDGLDAVDDLRRELEAYELPRPRSIRRRSKWADDPGGVFDFNRFSDGQEAYRTTDVRHVISHQYVTLLVDSILTKHTSARVGYWRGVTAAVAAEKLEAAGYSVEILGYECGSECQVNCTTRRHEDNVTGVWIKRFGEPLDVGSLVSACAPWYLRTAHFATLHMIPGSLPPDEYGYVDTLDHGLIPSITDNPDVSVIESVWSAEGASSAARRVLAKYSDEPGESHDEDGDD